MIKIPDFTSFHNAVEEMLGKTLDELRLQLRESGVPIDLGDLIETEQGLFGIIEKNGQLFVARILLHILDRDVRGLPVWPRTAETISQVSERDFFIKKLHKYHFMHCGTLKEMFAAKREHRYRQSQRVNGRFVYHYLNQKNDVPVYKNNRQKLHVCKNCLDQAKIRHRLFYTVDNFSPEEFFNHVDKDDWILDEGYTTETQDIGNNLYVKDWAKISKRVKNMRKYTCERCHIVLSAPTKQKYLHCHHVHGNKKDNRLSQLKCLCIKCHSEQEKHGHLKTHPDYGPFMDIWKNNRP